jgi:predicted transposase YbfD/YdcC
MDTPSNLALTEHFVALEDPRVERTKLHPLLSVVVIALCGVICGAETWNEIEEFGEAMEDFFTDTLDLPNGIPSHDTFNRVFASLDPQQFQACFGSWMQAVASVLPAQVVAVDGKSVRRSAERGIGKEAIHMVSAWATENRLVLAQVKVDAKSNEITALPGLLRQLAIAGCIVTIDAMGCQRQIAQQIIDQGGDYVLALKANQGTLHEDVEDSFRQGQRTQFAGMDHDSGETVDKGHGRIETRRAWVIGDPAVMGWLQDHHRWPGLGAIGMVEAQRRIGTDVEAETRYYLLSRCLTAAQFAQAVRSHWGIENRVHWVLDMAFREDLSRIRQGHAAQNFAVLRRLALNLLQRHPTKRKLSIKARRLKAGWDRAYLLRLLTDA